jgi:hypothetical protein
MSDSITADSARGVEPYLRRSFDRFCIETAPQVLVVLELPSGIASDGFGSNQVAEMRDIGYGKAKHTHRLCTTGCSYCGVGTRLSTKRVSRSQASQPSTRFRCKENFSLFGLISFCCFKIVLGLIRARWVNLSFFSFCKHAVCEARIQPIPAAQFHHFSRENSSEK